MNETRNFDFVFFLKFLFCSIEFPWEILVYIASHLIFMDEIV